MINTFFSDLSFFTCLFFGIHENCLHRVLVFIKHVTVPKKKSPKSEWRQRVENQSINVFPLPLVFFYLYHLFFKILNSTDPHSFLSLQQSSSYAGRDPEQNIELKKKVLNFFNVLTLSGSRFQHPDPDQDPNSGLGSKKKRMRTHNLDPHSFFLSPLLFSWDGDLNLEPDLDTNFNKEKRKKVKRPLITANFFFLRKSLKFRCFLIFNNFLYLF